MTRFLKMSMALIVFECSFNSNYVLRHSVLAQDSEHLSSRSALMEDFASDLDDIALNINAEFERFKATFNRSYSTMTEELKRLHNFLVTGRLIRDLRASEMGTAVYGVNEMSDMSEAEFWTYRANLDSTELVKEFEQMEEVKVKARRGGNPKTLDWRAQGKVTPVKDQGRCGSCWAFSVTGQIESRNLIVNPDSLDKTFSEQQMVDCDPKSYGCLGGWMNSALEYAMKAGGLQSDITYPYEEKTRSCRFNSSAIAVRITANKKLPSRNEMTMENYIANFGPVSAAINARILQVYKSGIIKQPRWKCWNGNGDVNHAVVIVGYGVEKVKHWDVPYWIIKNSWGSSWGENGYARIARRRNTCGIENFVNAGEVETVK